MHGAALWTKVILLFSSKFLQKTTRYYNGIFHAVSTICIDEGVKGLYKGLGATLLVGHEPFNYITFDLFNVGSPLILLELQGVGPSIAISFSVYESLRSHWQMERCSSLLLFVLYYNTLLNLLSKIATDAYEHICIRPHDSTAVVSLFSGSLSGIASSTGKN